MKHFLLNFTLLLFACLLPLSPIIAQFTISGELRPRAEYRHGYKTLANKNQESAFFTTQRTRLNARFKAKGVKVFMSLQDVRTWGNQSQLTTENGNATSFHQAWAEVKLAKKWAIKLGRQEIIYDDQRIFGASNWAQQARSHDAALLTFQDSTFKAHLGLAYNQSAPRLSGTPYTTSNNYKTIQYLWLHKQWNKFNLSALVLNNGLQVIPAIGEPKTNFSQTLGSRISWEEQSVKTNLAFYYQLGTDADELDTRLNAYYVGGDITYTPKEHLSFNTGVELFSGNDQIDLNDKNNAFMALYGANHRYNGHMDYFYVGNHARSVGLVDVFLKAKYQKGKITENLALHSFLSEGKVADSLGDKMPNWLGLEIDYSFGYQINKWATLQVGYSHLFGSNTMEVLKGGDKTTVNNWAYAMLIVKPSFDIKTKK